MTQKEQRGKTVQTKLSLGLYKNFKRKQIDTEWYDAGEVLRKFITMWVEGEITLPDRPSRPAKSKRK